MTKFCINCGEPIANENAYACSNCGKPVSKIISYHSDADSSEPAKTSHTSAYNTSASGTSETKTSASYISSTQTKHPFLALALSFIWTGLGQVYNGRFWRGVFFYFAVPIGAVCLIIPGIVMWVWCLWDAYTMTEKINRGELPYVEPTVWQIIGFICIPVILGAVLFLIYFAFIFLMIMGASM